MLSGQFAGKPQLADLNTSGTKPGRELVAVIAGSMHHVQTGVLHALTWRASGQTRHPKW